MKTCTKCNKTLPMESFFRRKTSQDGRASQCKPCAQIAVKAWHAAHKDDERRKMLKRESVYRYLSTPAGKAMRKRYRDRTGYTQDYRTRNPDKRAAHVAVQRAVDDGRLTVLPCEVCGLQNADAHHEDYSKPLDVVWLCRKHHTERHRNIDIPLSVFVTSTQQETNV